MSVDDHVQVDILQLSILGSSQPAVCLEAKRTTAYHDPTPSFACHLSNPNSHPLTHPSFLSPC